MIENINPQKLAINIVHSKVGNFPLLENAPLLDNIAKICHNGHLFNNDIEINILLNGKDAYSEKAELINAIIGRKSSIEDLLKVDSSTKKFDVGFKFRNIDLVYNFDMIYSDSNLNKQAQPVLIKIWSLNNPADIETLLPLGVARDVLQELSSYTYYINVDEDDNFYDISELGKLQLALDKIINPIAAFGFRWNYYKYLNERLWVHNKLNPTDSVYWSKPKILENDEKGRLETPLKFENYRGLCSWNLVHNKDYYKLCRLRRPAINKYDDCFFYSKLVQHCKNISFIQVMLYDYHQEHGTMNKEKDEYLDEVTKYITEEPFTVDQIIPFENPYALY